MARKGPAKKKIRKKTKKNQELKVQFMKIVSGLFLVVSLVIAAGLGAHYFLKRPKPLQDKVPPTHIAIPAKTPAHHSKPVYEAFSKEKSPPLSPEKAPRHSAASKTPMVALIIDDMGYDRHLAAKFLELDAPITFSMLPHGPFNTSIVEKARKKGVEIMLHLPMEPTEYPHVKPGPGALLTAMTPDQLIAQLKKDIASVPDLVGVNNHMGSKMTASSEQMRQIFSILKKNNLFFIDSRTTKETQCRPSAALLKLPFAERDVFIDHIQDPEFIRKQIRRLIKRAQRQGYAIGIAHPHTITYEILKENMGQLKEKVTLTTASQVVNGRS